MTQLSRATYLSSASQTFDRSQMHALCEVSRANNREAGITGILLYVDGSFLQVVEGPGRAVEALLARVEQDSRHSGMMVMERTAARDRFFPDWSMEGRGVEYEDLTALYSPTESFAQVVRRLSGNSEALVVSTFLRKFFSVADPRYSLSA